MKMVKMLCAIKVLMENSIHHQSQTAEHSEKNKLLDLEKDGKNQTSTRIKVNVVLVYLYFSLLFQILKIKRRRMVHGASLNRSL